MDDLFVIQGSKDDLLPRDRWIFNPAARAGRYGVSRQRPELDVIARTNVTARTNERD